MTQELAFEPIHITPCFKASTNRFTKLFLFITLMVIAQDVIFAAYVNMNLEAHFSPKLLVMISNSLILVFAFLSLSEIVIIYNQIYQTKIIITGHHIEYVEGITSKRSIKINMAHIRTIDIEQSAAQRLLNVGTIRVAASSTDGYEITAAGISQPAKLRDYLKHRVGIILYDETPNSQIRYP